MRRGLETEKRILQAVITVAAMVPILGGAAGVAFGPPIGGGGFGAEADSHFRYLSGVLLAIGIAYLSLVRHIEREGRRLFMLTAIVTAGGCARALGMLVAGEHGRAITLALGMELIVAPVVYLWQARLAARAAAAGSMDAPADAG